MLGTWLGRLFCYMFGIYRHLYPDVLADHEAYECILYMMKDICCYGLVGVTAWLIRPIRISNHAVQGYAILCKLSKSILIRLQTFKEPGLLFHRPQFNV
ncbi:hypothetical protein [Paenibacillus donghaensis]|uniref:Uncharacterized protein n=1 Tax=Paenibacillus donghaensis TaxID=414771 RepID=A0A2Z2KGR6_9BACL|nr:hypothetical protein [Paenibacillus donghaensis]ASA22360.1 hypothetical protein B9T62_17150 [Paenibacillus donghaensis]